MAQKCLTQLAIK